MLKGRVPLFPFLLATAVLCVVAAAERPVHAVSCCHDFTVWKVAGDDVDHLSPRLLRALLRGSGYVHVLTVAAETRVTPSRVLVGATPDTSLLLRPADLKLTWTTTGAGRDAGSELRPGDVLIVGDAHSGVVNSLGRIDHYVEPCGPGGAVRRADEVFTLPNCHVGPGGWTLERLLSRAILAAETGAEGGAIASYAVTYPYLGSSVEVWRRSGATPAPAPTPRQVAPASPRPTRETEAEAEAEADVKAEARPAREESESGGRAKSMVDEADDADTARPAKRRVQPEDDESVDEPPADDATASPSRRRSPRGTDEESSDNATPGSEGSARGREPVDQLTGSDEDMNPDSQRSRTRMRDDSGDEPPDSSRDRPRARGGSDRSRTDEEDAAPETTDSPRSRRDPEADTNDDAGDTED